MPILVRGEVRPTEILCVREVRVGIPRELLDEVQRFYTLTLGLTAWPTELQIPGGWGVGNPQCGLYVEFRHDPEVDPMRRRFTLMVDSLAVLEERLARRECRTNACVVSAGVINTSCSRIPWGISSKSARLSRSDGQPRTREPGSD